MLPEKWCVKLTPENQAVVGGYYNQQTNEKNCYTGKVSLGSYLASHNVSNVSVMQGNVQASFYCSPSNTYPEISFADFKKWVLGLDEAHEKEEVIYEIY